jgi:hypothetical protein
VGAAALAGLIAAVLEPRERMRGGLAMFGAYTTHFLLDWLGNDGTPPIGVMALWPFTTGYYESDLHIFMAISRRYWLDGFWMHNIVAVTREVLMLGPVAAVIWWFRSRRARQIS